MSIILLWVAYKYVPELILSVFPFLYTTCTNADSALRGGGEGRLMIIWDPKVNLTLRKKKYRRINFLQIKLVLIYIYIIVMCTWYSKYFFHLWKFDFLFLRKGRENFCITPLRSTADFQRLLRISNEIIA